jgi:hypothetical protein
MRRRNEEISDKGFPLPDWYLEDYPEGEEEYSEKVPSKEMDSYLQTPVSAKRLVWSRWLLPFIGLLCVVFGALILMAAILEKPWVKTHQVVDEGVRRPITSIEREAAPTLSGVVGKGLEGESSGRGTLKHERPIVSKPPESRTMSAKRTIDEKAVIIGALEESEKTRAEERGYRDTLLGREIPEGDTRIKEETPKTIRVREEPSPREIHEKSRKEISQSRPVTPNAVKLERETGRIEVAPTKASEPREMSVREPSQRTHTKDLGDTRAPQKYDAPSTTKDKSIPIARLPIDARSSIEREERIIQIKIPSLIATEEEVKNFFAQYRERYARKDLEGLFSLFSSRAVENGRYGIEEMKKTYLDFFDKSQKLRYHIKDPKIEIYQNGVEVKARYKIEQTAKKGGKENIWWGDIRWILEREDGALKISLLDYRPQRSP